MSGYIGNPRQVFVTDSLTRSQVENAEFDFNNMPTVGGDPVVESGSNSDGEWTRWADGTQLVKIESVTTTPANNAVGSIYQSSVNSYPVPMPFISTKVPVSVSDDGNSTVWYGCRHVGSAFEVTVMFWSSSSNRDISISANGRWK